MSVYTLEWQAGWTFAIISLIIALMTTHQSVIVLATPFSLLLIAHFGYQSRLLMQVWEADNSESDP
jgi:hypothetical protein